MSQRRLIGSIVALVATLVIVAVSAHADYSRASYVLVCNPGNPVATVERQFVQDVFLKKIQSWPTGDSTRPVDLLPSSSIRRQFTEDLLRRSVEAVRIFWQQRIFAGRDLPPLEVASDEDVIKFVLRDKGAIGYVSAGAALKGAKALSVR